mgnify:CR=1 FL=1
MRYRLYTKTSEAWAGMLEAVSGAQKFIYLESFILADDEQTHRFFEALREKAVAGVRVKIIADRVGNFGFKSLDKKAFERAGAEVLTFTRWLYRNHRKVLVVDGETAFIGGVNISRAYADWIDLHVRLTGELVAPILRSFARVYELAGGKDPEVLSLRREPLPKVRKALYERKERFIAHWPFRGTTALRGYYRKAIAGARSRVTIVTPYFIPHRWLIRSLATAMARGVAVEVILPQYSADRLTNMANHAFARELHPRITFFFTPTMIHAKVLMVDDREGLIGSNNIDAQSFDFNLEASVVLRERGVVGDLRRIVADWKASALTLDAAIGPARWYDRIAGWFIRPLQPIL